MAPKKQWEKEFQKVEVTPPDIVYRHEWDAVPGKEEGLQFLPLPVTDILLMSSGGYECYSDQECIHALQALQRRDMNERGLPDIQYNYYIGGNGIVYEGRGWHIRSSKEPRFSHLDEVSLDMAFIGDFENKDPTRDMTLAGSKFLKYLLENGYVSERFEVTPLGLTRKPTDGEENGDNEKHVLRYAIMRDHNVMSDEQHGLPDGEEEKKLLTPYTDTVQI